MELLTLDEAKANLNKTTNVDDAELQDVVDEASDIVEDITGPIRPTTVTETHWNVGNVALGAYAPAIPYPYTPRLLLRKAPVLAVAQVSTAYLGVTSATYTTGISFDPPTGIVWLTDNVPLTGDVTVTYTAGRQSVPSNVRRAVKELVRHLWETQRGQSSSRASYDTEQYTQTASGYLVPNRVAEALGGMTVHTVG